MFMLWAFATSLIAVILANWMGLEGMTKLLFIFAISAICGMLYHHIFEHNKK